MRGRLAQSATGLLQGALAWWMAELRGLVPRRLRERRRRLYDADLRLDRDGWVLRDRAGQTTAVMPGDMAGLAEATHRLKGRRKQGRVRLVVPHGRCFIRQSELPRRMLGRAATILASELEIGTPFNAGTAHWDWYVRDPGSEPGLVMVEQVVLKRRDTEAALGGLAAHGVAVTAIAVEDAAGRHCLPVDLIRNDVLAGTEPPNLQAARRVLVAAAVMAVLAIVPAAFLRQAGTLSDLDAAIADATDAVALRPGLARGPLQLIGDALLARRNFPVTGVLDSLAASLPADSHLDHVFMEKDVVTIQGRTASAHNLERALGASRVFTVGHNTAQPDGDEGVPFTLRLKLRPAPLQPGA
ncbi:PilN domain-containing protein [Lichenihabitans sp. Uapishka_5]|uniref:PilN domain-containing protein n=1 Tax=Lichenihabitans sp. Uapishka_5 TaxID=3037302 RepID=UPI0029E7F752|nr:PilN domain-containing protein [Lichenihabitans sp. Uapishka_5]MDX7951716.1 PilN domain-containing protein [Lichenihabitans sp. Uapishka_5]